MQASSISINTRLLSDKIRNQLTTIQGMAELIRLENFNMQQKVDDILTASGELKAVADELTAASSTDDKALKNFNILVVEDEPIIQKVHCKMLEDLGCHVEVAENGKEAVEKYDNNEYKLILMDVRMPVMDGIEATKEIRRLEQEKSNKPTPIIGLSCDGKGVEKSCIDAGMNTFFIKPISKEVLQAILRDYIGHHGGENTQD
jgi:CheY-like chemotaxis protein